MSKNMKSLLFGSIGLGAGAALSLAFPGASGIPGTALMLIVCISAALCGASVPGFLSFNAKPIRATGAAVFFVVPWLIPPQGLTDEAQEDPAADEATEAPKTNEPEPAEGCPVTPPSPGGTRQPGTNTHPPAPRPGTTFKPPPLPSKPADTPAKAPRAGRPRTIFDGLFSRTTQAGAAKPTHK